ncbi:MAG TPA: ferredoxin [Acidimicrobiales bacterium]|nr:ferredoxin [Acidimicrobiales bacterium]
MNAPGIRLMVDPVACDGHGTCAEVFPEWVHSDEWGYPLIRREPVPAALVDHARRAVKACPRFALALLDTEGRPAR